MQVDAWTAIALNPNVGRLIALVAEVPALPTSDDGIANQNYSNVTAVRLLYNSEVSVPEMR
jgi:hypothetical protein